MKDWRRLNVSFTRARSKLIIFGSRKTLGNAQLLKDFFTLMEEKKWVVQLPSGAHTAHEHAFRGLGMAGSPKRAHGDGSSKMDENMGSPRPMKKAKGIKLETLAKGRPILRELLEHTE